MKRKKKILLITLITVAAIIFTYFAGGFIAFAIVTNAVIDVRGAELSWLDDKEEFLIQKVRRDYLLLNNREEIPFESNKETLMGYLYETSEPHGVIICAHGVNNLADGDSAQYENYFLSKGWDIFAIDMVGCGLSTGKGMKSLHESKYCVKDAIKTISNYEKTKDLPICLIGHSWGGYGVISASDNSDVKAVASFSSYDVPGEMMYGFAENHTSSLAILTKPALDLALFTSYGNKSYLSCHDVISKNEDINYVVIHGEEDEVVPLKKYSTLDNIKNSDHVTSILLEDYKHSTPWKSLQANNYYSSLEEELAKLHLEYDESLPKEVLDEFIKTIDKEKSSEINEELLDKINNIFLDSIQ